MEVKVVLAFILGELNSFKPLHGSPTNLSWDNKTKRETVVWLQAKRMSVREGSISVSYGKPFIAQDMSMPFLRSLAQLKR